MICKICGKEFNAANHIKKIHNITSKEYYDTYIKQGNDGKCKVCGKSTMFMGIKIGYKSYCSVKCAQNDPEVRKQVTETTKSNLKAKYGVENVQQISEVREKTKQTCKKRYGTEYSIASEKVRQKIVDRNIEKYGVAYPMQSEELKKHYTQAIIDKYGVDNIAKSELIQAKSRHTRKRNIETRYDTTGYVSVGSVANKYGQGWYHFRDQLNISIVKFGMYSYISIEDEEKAKQYFNTHFEGHKSYLEYDVLNFIKSIYDGNIISPTKKIIAPLELDIYIPEKKLAIEVNGLFYHSSIGGCKDKLYHFTKSKMCENLGIRLIHIYESEWYNDRDKIESLLRIALGKVDTKIYARQCEIRQITNAEAKPFNEKGHLQNHKQAEVTYGLFYKNELVQLMSFSRNKYNRNLKSDTEWSIERGCPGSNNIVVGGVNRLFRHFIEDYHPTKIFSYCDFNKFDGRSYEAIGMTFDGYTGPDKYWILDGQMIRRNPNQYQYYKEHADGVLYGSGSKKYVWKEET